MTKQEAIDILIAGCTNSSATKIVVMRSMLKDADCNQFITKDSADHVECDREALLAAVKPAKKQAKTVSARQG